VRSLHNLALRNLLARRLRTILTGIAITLGVAAVFATSLIGRAVEARTAELARQGSRASLQVTPREGDTLDARLLDLVRVHPAVALASPELQYSSLVNGVPLIVLGVDPEAYRQMEGPQVTQGRYLSSPNVQWAVIPERWSEQNDVRIGDRLTIPLSQSTVQIRVVGLLKREEDSGAIISDRTALIPLKTLQGFTGQHRRLGRIRIALRPGVEPRSAEADLSAALSGTPLGRESIVSQTGDGGQSNRLYVMMQGGLVLSGVVILLAAAFLIFNTFAMSVAERTREIGILRSLGLDQSGVLRGVLMEAGLLGASGACAGLPLGWGLAQGIVSLLVAWQGFEVQRLTLSWLGAIAAPLVGMAVALAAALLPARTAATVSPMAAILAVPHQEGESGHRFSRAWPTGVMIWSGSVGVVLWMIFFPGTQTLEFIQISLLCTGVALLTMVGGLLLLAVLATGLISLLKRALIGRLGVAGRLAGDHLARHRQRSMLTAGTLAVGLAMVITLGGVLDILLQSAEDLVFGLMQDDFVVFYMPSGQALEAVDPRSPPRQQEWPRQVLAAIDSVRERAYVYSLSVTQPVKDLEATPGTGLYALDEVETFLRVGSFRYEQGNLETALRIMRQGRGLLIMPATARRFGVGVGDELWVNTQHGHVAFRVAAVGGSPWFGTLVSRADAERYFGVLPPYGYLVTAQAGAAPGALRARLEAGLAGQPDYVVFDVGHQSQAIEEIMGKPMRALGTLLNGITLLALVIASLGQINTTTMSVIERVRELGVLRAVGMTCRQVHRMVLLEAASVGVVGALIGGIVGLSSALMYTLTWSTVGLASMGFGAPSWETVRGSIGSTLSSTLPLTILSLVAAPLVTVLAAWKPARRAAELPIVEAIRHEAAALGRK
jgi:putative ABC transport system permease protein